MCDNLSQIHEAKCAPTTHTHLLWDQNKLIIEATTSSHVVNLDKPEIRMKKNQISLLSVVVASAVLLCQSARATYYTEEFINYATGPLSSSDGLWNGAGDSQITVTNGSHSLDGTPLGLVSSYGDKANISGTNEIGVINIAAGITNVIPNGNYTKFVTATPSVFSPTNLPHVPLYTSFLYRFNTSGGATNGQAPMIACMELQSGGITSASGADAYWQLFARTNAGSIQLGIAKNVFNNAANVVTGGGVTNWATTNLTANQTFFVVVQLQLNATNGFGGTYTNGVDNIVNMWINPPAKYFGTNEANLPTPSATSPIGDGFNPTSTTGPGRFFVIGSGWSANLDELRCSTNWADVTPPVGQCITAGINSDPTNVTQSAEISAILNVGVVGTGATNQWQISQNGGSTWSNIPGALSPTYVTPNLQLATDNGNKYRAIVGVGCDNSSVTSQVATVTLTAPVVTPDGLVMDDTFADGFYGNTPITTNNSVWFTSNPANLDAYDDAPNGMVAYTITNTSTLYLGYFVNEATTNLPVDLAIGNQIKVTLSITPNDFSLFTVNGLLEFGLFDYADGGTPVVNDDSTVAGSTGNGVDVRGYMLGVDFGTNFSTSTPLTLYARNTLGDISLMSVLGDYLSMQSGPVGGGYSGAPAFKSGTNYSLVFSVTRTATNTCSVAATITGGGTNWTYSSTDTNSFGYHRFDAFGIYDKSGVTSVNNFLIPEFKVEVLPVTLAPTSITVTNVSYSGNHLIIGWSPSPAGSYTFSVLSKTNLTDAAWVTNATGISINSYTNTSATATRGFYRVSSP
jgi:hypothetical protein